MANKSNENLDGETHEIEPSQDVVVTQTSDTHLVVEKSVKKKLNKISKIHDDDENDNPVVQEHAVNAYKAKQAKIKGEEVPVKLNKDGSMRKKYTKKDLNNPVAEKERKKVSSKTKEEIAITSRTTAEMLQSVKFQLYEGLFDYKAEKVDKEIVVALTTDYLIEKGGVEISPLLMLTIMEAKMLSGVLNTKKGQTVKTRTKSWLAKKWIEFKTKKEIKKAEVKTDDKKESENDGA